MSIGRIIGIVVAILLVLWILANFAEVQHIFNHLMNKLASAANGS